MYSMEMIKSVLIRNMKLLRKSKGWTQEDLAEKAGFSTGFIKDIERGKSWVSPEAIEAIGAAFGVPCEVLFSSDHKGVLLDMPMSSAIKKLMAIPDNIYDLAQDLPKDDQCWVAVRLALESARERMEKLSKDGASSQS